MKYEKVGADIQFTFDIQSSKVMGYNFFNPPSGNVISISKFQNGIKKGKNVIKLKVAIAKLKTANNMTFKFIDQSNNDNYIYLKTDQLKYQ